MLSIPDGIARPLALALSPILLAQGRTLKRRMPQLPEAGGPRTGTAIAGAGASASATVGASDSPWSSEEAPLSLLVFGESTAAGVGVATNEQGLAGALARELAAVRGVDVNWSVTARTGYTALAARNKLLKHVTGEFDLIVVLLGVNDSLGLTPRESWARDYRAVLDALGTHLTPRGRIVCAGVPQMSHFRALSQPTRAVIGAHARSLDHRLSHCVSCISCVADTLYVDSPMPTGTGVLAADGFHPSTLGYEQWAEHLVAAIERHTASVHPHDPIPDAASRA